MLQTNYRALKEQLKQWAIAGKLHSSLKTFSLHKKSEQKYYIGVQKRMWLEGRSYWVVIKTILCYSRIHDLPLCEKNCS